MRTAADSGTVSPDAAYFWARINIDHDRKAEAKRILERALNTPRLFMFRKEAEDLMAQLTEIPAETKKPAAPNK